MPVIGARASAACKRMLVSHLTPLCEGNRRVKFGGISLAGVGGCVKSLTIVRLIVAWVARARTGSRRGMEEWRAVQ